MDSKKTMGAAASSSSSLDVKPALNEGETAMPVLKSDPSVREVLSVYGKLFRANKLELVSSEALEAGKRRSEETIRLIRSKTEEKLKALSAKASQAQSNK